MKPTENLRLVSETWRSAVRIIAPMAALVAWSCASPGTPAPLSVEQADQIAHGRYIAVSRCSYCHGVDGERASPRPEAPPLSTVLAGYNPDMLAEDFIDGARVGHDAMPVFDLTVLDADALVAYLRSINNPVSPM